MQLASNGDKEECSESEPILNHHHLHLQPPGEPSFSCEIIPISPNHDVDHDLQNVRVDETCNLVIADQPQCRICLDIGGLSLYVCVCILIILPLLHMLSLNLLDDFTTSDILWLTNLHLVLLIIQMIFQEKI